MSTELKTLLKEQIPGVDTDKIRTDYRSIWLDQNVAARYAGELDMQKSILLNSEKNNLPPIQVGAFEGHLIMTLLKMINAKRGVEVGTLGGYSSSWICRALESESNSKLYSLELNENFAAVARDNLKNWEPLVDVISGPALETLNGSLRDLRDLDFVFIDADKASYIHYFDWAWERLRKGGVVLIDNFYLFGGVYFSQCAEFPRVFTSKLSERDRFTETQWKGMKLLWDRLEGLGSDVQKTILPTSEGLGLVYKS